MGNSQRAGNYGALLFVARSKSADRLLQSMILLERHLGLPQEWQ